MWIDRQTADQTNEIKQKIESGINQSQKIHTLCVNKDRHFKN